MQHKSNILCTFLVLTIAGALNGCGPKPYHDENEAYYLVTVNVNLPYWKEAERGLTDAAAAMKVRAEMVGPESYSPEEQLKALQDVIAKKPAGILVSATRPELLRTAIDTAVIEGIPVICMDSDAPDSKRILFVGTDNFRAGQEGGKRMADLLQGKGDVVLVAIPGQLNLEERVRGVNEVFKKYPGVKISKTVDDKGDSRIAFDAVSAMVDKKEKFDGVLAVEASGGPGAADALHRYGMDTKIPVVAMDKNPETLEWISRGAIKATIAQKPYTMSFYGLKLLDDLHHNAVLQFKDWKTAPVSPLPTWVDTGTAVIDAKNLDTFRAAQPPANR